MPEIDLGNIQGPKGEKGDKGEQGIQGVQGEQGIQGIQGIQGVGIKEIVFKSQASDGGNIYTITLTNDNSYDFTAPIGPQGIQGPKGDKGETMVASLKWNDILEKPTTFPSTWNEVSGIPSTFPPNLHTHDDRYYTETEIEEKFKNFCPYSIGDIYITTLSTNPATKYLGTTWEKIEGRFLLSTSGSNASGQVGGSNTKTISKANLPNIKLQVDSFSVTTKKHTHGYRNFQYMSGINIGNGGNGTNWVTSQTGEAGGDNTGTASPYTSTLGSGTALDITPSFYTVHIWKRLT